ncbi:DUF6777 domain-containing protein [Streptomyces sp. NPDC049577]|uniref:DUF6777 domain-containing protein n=1 Tax=Streptomyces sp. NPDC049577 TaxID=3155153 RepID=UPI00342D2FF2
MSSEPPSGNRPAEPPSGPPSGPLSGRGPGPSEPSEPTRPDWPGPSAGRPEGPGGTPGPSGPQEPPEGPPAPPTGGPPGGGPGRHRPSWWRPRTAVITGLVVVAAVVAVVLLRQGGGPGEVTLQPAAAAGDDPFTRSTVKESGYGAATKPSVPADGKRTVQGNTPGLYGGTRNVASCDVDRQISYLGQDQGKARAFAGAAGVDPGNLTAYLHGLTSLQLRADTRVTNHGYKDGSVTSYQAVLQAGTAVLVDDRGVPRVRCACGNPLGPPVAANGTPKAKGQSWDAYKPSDVIVVDPADSVMESFIVYDPATGEWFERPVGGDGDSDRSVSAPGGGMTPAPTKGATPTGPAPTHGPSQAPPPPPKPSAPQRTTPQTTTVPPTSPGPAYGPPDRAASAPDAR